MCLLENIQNKYFGKQHLIEIFSYKVPLREHGLPENIMNGNLFGYV